MTDASPAERLYYLCLVLVPNTEMAALVLCKRQSCEADFCRKHLKKAGI